MSLAFGVPAVVSSIAAEGMHLVDGQDVLVADDPSAFADGVVRIYESESIWSRLSANGQLNIDRHFSTSVVATKLDSLLLDVGMGGGATLPLRRIEPNRPPISVQKAS